MSIRAAYDVAKKLQIRIVEDESLSRSGMWSRGRTIKINPKKASTYTVLHEIGHVLCGYGCCREHAEYQAHGAAIALARVFEIRLTRQQLSRIDSYAGKSARRACAAIEKRRHPRRRR